MSRRYNKRRSAINTPTLVAVAALTILAGLIIHATCDRSHNRHFTTAQTGIDSLAWVATPDSHHGEMLDYQHFVVDFNHEHHQPNYASWILTRDMVENATAPRKNNFRPDPDVVGSATPADYRNSGFDRGHIVPAGDMKHDPEAMDRTFFMTNISPQTGELNSGAWKKLEDNCRAWALRDSVLVIVAGPILTDRLTQSIGLTRVSVPQRYFKVILAPFAAGEPRAIGFIMNNGANPGGVQSTAVSVRQVEEITGYDFFSSLPDDIENTIENDARYSAWQYSR